MPGLLNESGSEPVSEPIGEPFGAPFSELFTEQVNCTILSSLTHENNSDATHDHCFQSWISCYFTPFKNNLLTCIQGIMLIALFRFLSFIPLPVLHGIGATLGWLVYLLSPAYRRRLTENIRLAGFETSTVQAISEAGKSILELPFIWFADPKRVLAKATIENWPVAQQALDQNKGVIFLTPHLGCFEIIAQAIAVKTTLTALYRPPRKKTLQPLMMGARSRTNLLLAPANLGGVKQMLKALKKGGAVGLLPDQVPQEGEGVWADFFGRPAYTMTLSSKLHTMTGAPIILTYAERLPWARGYLIRFVPFEQLTALSVSGTPEQQATAINQAMEKLISFCPSEYFWSYNRYKIPAHASTTLPTTSKDDN